MLCILHTSMYMNINLRNMDFYILEKYSSAVIYKCCRPYYSTTPQDARRSQRMKACHHWKLILHHERMGLFLVAQTLKNSLAMRETRVWSLGREDPWRRKWKLTPVFLFGKSHGQKSLVCYSLWGRQEWDATKHTRMQELLQLCCLRGRI